MRIKIANISFCVLLTFHAYGQIGGNHSFAFLNMVHSSRAAALGGASIAVKDADVSMAMLNPAVLNENMMSDLTVNHNFHFADIQHGMFNLGYKINSLGLHMHTGIQYINYGNFIRADVFGNKQGEFDAQEIAVVVGASRKLNERIQIGINFKMANSRFDSYSSFGLAGDLGFIYENPESKFIFAFVAQSIGVQLSSYADISESLPLNLQIGFSKRFAHLPFQISVTAHHLNDWELLYENPEAVDPSGLFGAELPNSSGFSSEVDNFFRHLIFAGEFFIGKSDNIRLRLAYNHQRKKELSVSTFRSLGGFSVGFGMKIKKFRIDYGVGYYHLAGAANHLGLAINLNELRSKI